MAPEATVGTADATTTAVDARIPAEDTTAPSSAEEHTVSEAAAGPKLSKKQVAQAKMFGRDKGLEAKAAEKPSLTADQDPNRTNVLESWFIAPKKTWGSGPAQPAKTLKIVREMSDLHGLRSHEE